MKLALPAAVLAGLAAGLLAFGMVRGDQGAVLGTSHDLGTLGVSACEVCHLPHEAGGEPLWTDSPYPDDDAFSGIAPDCYSCHDGTVAGGAHAFDQSLAQHPVEPGEPGEDCDMCHDPHVPDYGSFLLFPSGANLCKTCHTDGFSHPLNVEAVAHGYVPADVQWDPDAGDFSGTRLWDPLGTGPGDTLKCLSCHAAHGAPAEGLLSAGEDGTSLCESCHHW